MCNVRNRAVIELPTVVSIRGFLKIDRWRLIVEYPDNRRVVYYIIDK